jgi:hypothetical protein
LPLRVPRLVVERRHPAAGHHRRILAANTPVDLVTRPARSGSVAGAGIPTAYGTVSLIAVAIAAMARLAVTRRARTVAIVPRLAMV